MPALNVLIPDVEVLLGLPPESLAGAILQDLNDALEPEIEQRNRSNPSNYTTLLFRAPNECYPREHQEGVFRAILEAWAWLEREGLLIESHNFGGAREYFVTRRGEQLADEEAFAAYRQASQLPKELLHPAIADDCWINFISGRYDTAVFEAFRAVEIAVRAAGEFAAADLGVVMMRRAFRPDDGPLSDAALPSAEQQALSDLFAGAIGSYKNPHSHRAAVITDPNDAVGMLMLASHLLRIVDTRAA